MVGIKDLKSLRLNPLKELASDYKRKVEGSIAEMSLKHRLHRDSLKTIKNQIDVLFAEKRRLEQIEKGVEEPLRKRMKVIDCPNFFSSPRERRPVFCPDANDKRSGSEPSPCEGMADDAREGSADAGQGKPGRGFRGGARGGGRGRGRGTWNRTDNGRATNETNSFQKQENRIYEGRQADGHDTDEEEEAR